MNKIGFRSERGPVLISLMLATGLIALDTTVLGTAVPSIVGELGGLTQFPWLFSSYLLASAVTTPIYAKLADMVGRKPIMVFGVAAFLAGSVLCGIAWNMLSLILFRAVQGLAAGAIMPVAITILGDIYSVPERARVQGYMSSVWGVASILGPLVGGVVSELGLWRVVFFINIPLCLIAGHLFLRHFHEVVERRPRRLDAAGGLLLTGAMTLIVLALLEGGQAWAWNSWQSIGAFAIGGAMLAGFVLVERRAPDPILPLWIFSRRLLATGILVSVTAYAALLGIIGWVPLYLEGSLGVTPTIAGIALGGLLISWPFATVLSGRLYLRFGFRNTTIGGFALLCAGSCALPVVAHTPTVAGVTALSFVIGFGIGVGIVPPLVAAQATVTWHERGVVTGANVFARSLGSAVGVAVYGAIANSVIGATDLDEVAPAAIIDAAFLVFVGVAVTAIAALLAAIAMPRTPTVPGVFSAGV
jgi:EmrB/QacA subfamily drug resistance transporter